MNTVLLCLYVYAIRAVFATDEQYTCNNCSGKVAGGYCIRVCNNKRDSRNWCYCETTDSRCSHAGQYGQWEYCNISDQTYPLFEYSCSDDYGNLCYKFRGKPFPYTQTWDRANRRCKHRKYPGLATISRSGTQHFLESILILRNKWEFQKMWIGGKRKNGVWKWDVNNKEIPRDGQYFTTEEDILRADQHCILLLGIAPHNFTWNDYYCDNRNIKRYPYVTSYLCGTEEYFDVTTPTMERTTTRMAEIPTITTETTLTEVTTEPSVDTMKMNATIWHPASANTRISVETEVETVDNSTPSNSARPGTSRLEAKQSSKDNQSTYGIVGGTAAVLILVALSIIGFKLRWFDWFPKSKSPKAQFDNLSYTPEGYSPSKGEYSENGYENTDINVGLNVVTHGAKTNAIESPTEMIVADEYAIVLQKTFGNSNHDPDLVFMDNDLYGSDDVIEDTMVGNEIYE